MLTPTACNLCKARSSKIVTDPSSGEVICSDCGMILSDKAEQTGAEWRTFADSSQATNNNNDNRSRTGSPRSLARHDMGLYTIIANTDRDAKGQKLDTLIRSTMGRLRTWDYRTQAHTSSDRNLSQAFNQLDRLKDKLGLSDAVVEKTAYIYRKAQLRGLVRGRQIHSVLAATVYIACRELESPRILKDIAETSNIKRKDITRNYRRLVIELDLKIPIVEPMKCITRIANKVNVSQKTKRKAIDIMCNITKRGGISAGKNPMGLAATVLYLSCSLTGEDNIAQTMFAKTAGVTEVTIRNISRVLNKLAIK
jgi:transcription initiation factor TFIIB